jgi:hypothetical protein
LAYDIYCVLRSGGAFLPAHVAALKWAIDKHATGATLWCLTDTPGEMPDGVRAIPLKYGWPGWWSKMELFRPDLGGNKLYFDLDTMIVGEMSALLDEERLVLLRDPYRPDGICSGIMSIPDDRSQEVWSKFFRDPAGYISRFEEGDGDTWGDQAFLETLWLYDALRWQDEHPGHFVSYKADNVAENGTQGSTVVYFHGQPRPWDTDLWALFGPPSDEPDA